MSRIIGAALVAGLVCSSTIWGLSPAAATELELTGQDFEVIIRDEVEPGDRPRFDVVETNLAGLGEIVAGVESNQTLQVNGGARLSDAPTDPYVADQWGPELAGLGDVWDETLGNSDTVIAVLDSGVAAAAAEIGDRLLPGMSFVDGDPHVDELGHGTWVAGIAAAAHDGQGIAGVCPRCSILPVQVADATGFVPWSAAADGIVYAVDAGVDVINLSFGSPVMPEIVFDAVAYADANGVIVIGAAGNDGTDVPFYPAAGPGVISVAAHDQNRERYSWSSFGDWVDVAAPGCSVALVGDSYSPICGTSFAAPWVSGLVGLLLDEHGTLDPAAVELRLETGAAPVEWVESGQVNAFAALHGQPRFGDVDAGAYYSEAVDWLVEVGVTNGTSLTTFSPDQAVTRGQLATFLWRLNATPTAAGGSAFGDVDAGAYYSEAVDWLVEVGVTNGTSLTTFSPDQAVTRGQLATFLWRLNVLAA